MDVSGARGQATTDSCGKLFLKAFGAMALTLELQETASVMGFSMKGTLLEYLPSPEGNATRA